MLEESKIDLLDADDDAEKWHDVLAGMGDVYFSPDWLELHCRNQDDRGKLFCYTEGQRTEGQQSWFYPYILRPLPRHYGVDGYDIESAYGYGGPWSTTNDPDFLQRARAGFESWCKENRVIAEFCAFHPLISNEQWMKGGMMLFNDRKTMALSLDSDVALSDHYSRDGAYMVRRGARGGIVVSELPVQEHFDQFVKMYCKAMNSLGASSFYLFDNTYFEKLKKLIQKSGWMTVAELDGEWVAASLFMHGGRYLHYHLSANNFDVKAPGATNMILDAAARQGAALGLEAFHLGGGRTPDEKDSLLKFKRSMGDQQLDFFIGKMIHNKKAYKEVCDQWKQDHPELEKTHGNRLLKYRLD